MKEELEILDPSAKQGHEAKNLRKSLPGLVGTIVGFIDNAKPNFNYLVDDLAEILTTQYGVRQVIKRRKRGASLPADKSVVEELASQCDFVITGSGD
jgi:hypothetical protein